MAAHKKKGIAVYLDSEEEKAKIASVKRDLTFSQWGKRAFKNQLVEDLMRFEQEQKLQQAKLGLINESTKNLQGSRIGTPASQAAVATPKTPTSTAEATSLMDTVDNDVAGGNLEVNDS